MDPAISPGGQLSTLTKRVAQRLFRIGENRLELLLVELQEERQCLLHFLLLALGAAVFGILAGVALSGLVVVALWQYSPAGALLLLAALYSVAALLLYRRLTALGHDWQPLADTLDQIRKDRVCLEKELS